MHSRLRLVLMAMMLACLAVVSPAKDKRRHHPSQPIFVITNDDGLLANDVSFWLPEIRSRAPVDFTNHARHRRQRNRRRLLWLAAGSYAA